MSFFKDIFTPSQEQQSVQGQQNPEQKQQKLGDSPPLDKEGKPTGSKETPVNPLDAYAKMFENAAKASPITAPNFKLDPKVLSDVSATMDFTKSIEPQMMEKALQGDAKALLAIVQEVGRNTYRASLEHATALTEKHLSQRADYDTQKLNTGVRQQLTSNALSSAQNYNHPVIKAELTRVANQFASANPDASPQEVAAAAQKYIADLAAALAPTAETTSKGSTQEVDWVNYLSH